MESFLLSGGVDEGFCPIEYDSDSAFRWARSRFHLRRPQGQHYLDLVLGREIPGRLTIESNQRHEHNVELAPGWHEYRGSLNNTIRRARQIQFLGTYVYRK